MFPPAHPAARLLAELEPWAEVHVGTEPGLIARWGPAAEVILYSSMGGGTPPITGVWPHRGAGLRWIHSFEAGVDPMLTPEIVASPVAVSNARGVYAAPLAEFAILGILFFYKHVRRLLAQQAGARWEKFEVESPQGKLLGVVGYGAVGRACAEAARGLGMRVSAAGRQWQRAELLQMLAGVDVLLAAAPLTPATHHLIDAGAFAALKPSALVINVGRGPVLDEAALIAALRSGRLAGAALDVFEHEPLPPQHPFWTMDNVLLSPHCTDRTRDPHWAELGMRCFIDNFHRYRQHQPLLTPVDKTLGY
ncbi:MAG: D-2-hydroxyacid dehydrogenase [Terriglobales bacterium]